MEAVDSKGLAEKKQKHEACFPKAGCKSTKIPPSSLPGERIYSLETTPEELTQQISLTDPYLPLAFPICSPWKLKVPALGLCPWSH